MILLFTDVATDEKYVVNYDNVNRFTYLQTPEGKYFVNIRYNDGFNESFYSTYQSLRNVITQVEAGIMKQTLVKI